MSATTTHNGAQPFELRGSLFTLTVLYLQSSELAAIDQLLEQKISQAPGFFQNAPVILDLERLDAEAGVDFVGLYDLLRNRGMVPVAVRNGADAQRQAAAVARLPALPPRLPLDPERANADAAQSDKSTANDAAANDAAANDVDDATDDTNAPIPAPGYRIHTQPIRSGQKIYARGDLVLLGPVSAGAEVVADGNIHAYAALRGRALAGASGDLKARIFCQHLEAELVAIAGNYRVIENDNADIWQQTVQVYLDKGERLIIEKLSR